MEECKCKPAKSYAERIIEYKEFVSLVKRMREAQVVEQCTRGGSLFKDTKNMLRHLRWLDKRERLESEVDEYLKKMES
jgi:uncharacterized C2H2 Zn-finger protein